VKISRQTREIINTVLVLLVIALLVVVYLIYPLGRVKTMHGRANLDDYEQDTVVVNDPTPWLEAGLLPDTFSVEADGLTTLAALYMTPGDTVPAGATIDTTAADTADTPADTVTDSVVVSTVTAGPDSVAGLAILVHHEYHSRDSLIGLAKRFLDRGYAVVAYDQRASGHSTGKYHGEGQYEASDLHEVIAWLVFREKVAHPAVAVGWGLGGDAAIMAAQEDKRLDRVVAIRPYLTTERWLSLTRQLHETWWFPLYQTITWFWYNIRSSYAAAFRETEHIETVACPALLLIEEESKEDDAVVRLKEVSENDLLTIETVPDNRKAVYDRIMQYAPAGDTAAVAGE
jgi:pimeloyl-ACP methyl ester carboxylesterase